MKSTMTWLPLTTALILLTPTGCADDGGGDDELGGETAGDGDGDTNTGDGDSNTGDGDSGDGDGDSGDGDGDSGDGDGDGDSGDGDGDSTGDGDGDTTGDGDGDMGMTVELLVNSAVIREANNGGELTASCMLFENGLPAGVQPVFEYAVAPAQGVTDNGDSWAFADFGTWTVSCTTTVDNVELGAEDEFAVLNDAFDRRLADVGLALGSSQAALSAVLAADGGEDQALVDAIAALAAVEPALADPEVDLAGLSDILVPLPGGYPNAAALDNAGILANADDDSYAAALTEVDGAFDDLAAFYASLDPDVAPTMDELLALEAAGAQFDATVAAFGALEPSAHGALAHREALALSFRDHLVPTLEAINAYVVARAQAEADQLFGLQPPEPPEPGLTPKFGLLGLTMGMFGQSYIRVNLANKMYGDAIAALDKSINNLILNDLLNYVFPPNANGPIIDLFFASASQGFALPGYDTWAYGSGFNSDPNFNMFIILGDNWQGVVDNVLGACDVSEDNSIPENIENMQNCVQDVQDAVDSAVNYSMEVIEPGMLGGQDVHLGPFPMACQGFLPVATLVIPINLAVGRGETWLTNCLP